MLVLVVAAAATLGSDLQGVRALSASVSKLLIDAGNAASDTVDQQMLLEQVEALLSCAAAEDSDAYDSPSCGSAPLNYDAALAAFEAGTHPLCSTVTAPQAAEPAVAEDWQADVLRRSIRDEALERERDLRERAEMRAKQAEQQLADILASRDREERAPAGSESADQQPSSEKPDS